MMAARLPGADVDRLTGQIAGLKLLPRHVGDLLEHLEAQAGSLASGAAIGASALRAQTVGCAGCCRSPCGETDVLRRVRSADAASVQKRRSQASATAVTGTRI